MIASINMHDAASSILNHLKSSPIGWRRWFLRMLSKPESGDHPESRRRHRGTEPPKDAVGILTADHTSRFHSRLCGHQAKALKSTMHQRKRHYASGCLPFIPFWSFLRAQKAGSSGTIWSNIIEHDPVISIDFLGAFEYKRNSHSDKCPKDSQVLKVSSTWSRFKLGVVGACSWYVNCTWMSTAGITEWKALAAQPCNYENEKAWIWDMHSHGLLSLAPAFSLEPSWKITVFSTAATTPQPCHPARVSVRK